MAHKVKKKPSRPMLTVHRRGYHRKGYVRKGKIKVSPTYVPPAKFKIKDVGAVGRGKKVVKIARKGALKKLGYSTGASEVARRRALSKAMRQFGEPTVFRMLQAQVVLRKRTQPEARRVFERDRDWVVEQMSPTQRLKMTAPARKEWMGMSPRARALAMPERT